MKKNFIKLLLIVFLLIGVNVSAVFATNIANKNTNKEVITQESVVSEGEQENTVVSNNTEEKNNGLGLIAVALATGLACIGAGIAVATVGASAVGAISENPKLLGKTIIFAGLAEGIAIYGLIISIMILNKI